MFVTATQRPHEAVSEKLVVVVVVVVVVRAPNSGLQKTYSDNLGAKPRRATIREALHVRNGKEVARPASVLTWT